MIFKHLTIAIVSYKSNFQLLKCLKSLSALKKILVFDNSNDLVLKKKINIKYPYIKYYSSKKNLGYGVANNFLLKKIKTKYCLLLNPDSRITIQNILKMLDIAKKLNDNFFLLTPSNKSYSMKDYFFNKKKNIKKKNIIEIDTTHFYAPLINMNKQKKRKIYFDKNFFLYYEDIDFCREIKKKNEKIYLIKNIFAEHYFGKSSNSKNYNMIRNFHWGWSSVYYYKKHFNDLLFYTYIGKLILKTIVAFIIYNFLLNKTRSQNLKIRLSGIFNAFKTKYDYYREKY